MVQEGHSPPRQRSLQPRRRAPRGARDRRDSFIFLPRRTAKITWETGWGARRQRAPSGRERESDYLWRVSLFVKQLSHGGRVTARLPKDWSQELRTVWHSAQSETSQTSFSYEPASVFEISTRCKTLRIKRTMWDCKLHYYFCMIYLKKLRKTWTFQSNGTISLVLLIFIS